MKARVLELIVCPECRGTLSLEKEFERDGNSRELLQGLLRCTGCARPYPVINGVPRLLPVSLQHYSRAYHAHFFEKYEVDQIDEPVSKVGLNIPGTTPVGRTLQKYSYQWREFFEMYDIWREDFLDCFSPSTPEFFCGKLGVDAGCGFGRLLFWAAEFGAEVIGVELSEGVESAFRITRRSDRVHVVQGDIYHLPVREGIFDFAYSIGVLHHLPDPEGGFKCLVPLVKPGGRINVWVYGPRYDWVEKLSRALRRRTTRMNPRLLWGICVLMAGSLRLFSHYPYKVLRRIPGLQRLAASLPLHAHHHHPFRAVVAGAFDRLSVPLEQFYTGEQLRGWFERASLRDIIISRRFLNYEFWLGQGIK